MDNHDWMYTGHAEMTPEWMCNTSAFLDHAFGRLLKGRVGCRVPVANVTTGKEKNRKKVGEDLCKFGFTPNYTCWIFHGEADRMREEVVRQRLEDFYGDAGVPDMMDDFHEAQFGEGMEEEPEETAKAFYDMMSSA